jgi:polar amino acid transport system permease protein
MDLTSLDFTAVWKYREALAWGLWTTLWLAAAGFAIAVPAGLLLALGRLRGQWWLRGLILGFVDVVRFTPLLVQAVWIHFALPALTGVSMSVTQSGLLALSLHVSAYVCEIMRAGIVAIPKGQWEAARAMGLRPRPIFRLVVLPQVWPLVLPPLANVAVSTLKLTSILSIIAIDDLLKVANRINASTYRPLEIFTAAALIYLAVGLVLAWGAAALERRYGAGRLRLPATVAPALVPVAAPAPVAATLGGRNGP